MWDFYFEKKKRTMWNSGLPTILVNPYLLGRWATKFHLHSALHPPTSSTRKRRPDPSRPWGWGFGLENCRVWSCWETQLVLSERKKQGTTGISCWKDQWITLFLPQSWTWKTGSWKMCDLSPNGLFYTSIYYGRKGITYTIKVGCLHPVSRWVINQLTNKDLYTLPVQVQTPALVGPLILRVVPYANSYVPA